VKVEVRRTTGEVLKRKKSISRDVIGIQKKGPPRNMPGRKRGMGGKKKRHNQCERHWRPQGRPVWVSFSFWEGEHRQGTRRVIRKKREKHT